MTAAGNHTPCIAILFCQKLAGAPAPFSVDDLNTVFGFAQNEWLYFFTVVDETGEVFYVFFGDFVRVVRVWLDVFDVEPVKSHLTQKRIASIIVGHFVSNRRILVVSCIKCSDS